MANFDEILTKGKSKVKGSAGTKTKKDLWKEHISLLITVMTKLNNMYGDDTKHHFLIEQAKCSKCGKATYLIAIRDIENHKQVIRFHNSSWKVVSKDTYHCEICKK